MVQLVLLCSMLATVRAISGPDWTSVVRNVKIDYDLEGSPIQIRTDSVEGSGDFIRIYLYEDDEGYIGFIELNPYGDPAVLYFINYCTTIWTNFQADIPADQDKVWTITKTETALKIECNDVELLNLVYSDASADCAGKYSRDVEKIEFYSGDTASDEYREQPTVAAVSSVSVELNGENVYSVDYQTRQYFLYIEDKEPEITCSVSGLSAAPSMQFLKEGNTLEYVLPSSLYILETETSEDGQTHHLRWQIDASGYTEIVGNWTCSVQTSNGDQYEKAFNTLCTSKPYIIFSPALVHGVAREGTTITMKCNCNTLDELRNDREWGWFIDDASPAGKRLSYEGAGSDDGLYPTDTLAISNLEYIDSARYSCNCKVGPYKTVQFNSPDVQMTVMRPPGIPKDIVLLEATMDKLSLVWRNSEDMGIVLEYKISYKRTGSRAYKEVNTHSSEQEHDLLDLDPWTEYSVKIAAANNAGTGTPSNVVTFTTTQPIQSRPVIQEPENAARGEFNDEGHYIMDAASVGEDLRLLCEVNSYPAPSIEWKFNNIDVAAAAGGVPNNLEQSLPTQPKSTFTTESVLTIKSTRQANNGSYSCIATNIQGQDTLTYIVQVAAEETDNGNDLSKSAPLLSALSVLTILLTAVVVHRL